MAALHVESHGSGAPLVMLHGWGMHGGIWGGVVDQLAQHCRVLCVDLPGHGYSALPSPDGRGAGVTNDLAVVVGQPSQMASSSISEGAHDEKSAPNLGQSLTLALSRREREPDRQLLLDAIVEQLSAQFDEPLNVCGWSLGGKVALRWAQLHPAQVEKLVLVASTPCFVQRDDWQCAMAGAVLQEFAHALTLHFQLTLQRFLALQMRGSEAERAVLLELRARMFSRGEPDVASLQAGLQILRDTDLRMMLPQLAQAALVIAGERDSLIPAAASAYLAQQMPDARLVSIAGAAHAPFLSHADIFVEQITSFLHE